MSRAALQDEPGRLAGRAAVHQPSVHGEHLDSHATLVLYADHIATDLKAQAILQARDDRRGIGNSDFLATALAVGIRADAVNFIFPIAYVYCVIKTEITCENSVHIFGQSIKTLTNKYHSLLKVISLYLYMGNRPCIIARVIIPDIKNLNCWRQRKQVKGEIMRIEYLHCPPAPIMRVDLSCKAANAVCFPHFILPCPSPVKRGDTGIVIFSEGSAEQVRGHFHAQGVSKNRGFDIPVLVVSFMYHLTESTTASCPSRDMATSSPSRKTDCPLSPFTVASKVPCPPSTVWAPVSITG